MSRKKTEKKMPKKTLSDNVVKPEPEQNKSQEVLELDVAVPMYIAGYRNRADFEDGALNRFLFHKKIKTKIARIVLDRNMDVDKQGKCMTKITVYLKN